MNRKRQLAGILLLLAAGPAFCADWWKHPLDAEMKGLLQGSNAYEVYQAVGADLITGVIVTDGTLGLIQVPNIVDFRVVVRGFVMTPDTATLRLLGGGRMQATRRELFIEGGSRTFFAICRTDFCNFGGPEWEIDAQPFVNNPFTNEPLACAETLSCGGFEQIEQQDTTRSWRGYEAGDIVFARKGFFANGFE